MAERLMAEIKKIAPKWIVTRDNVVESPKGVTLSPRKTRVVPKYSGEEGQSTTLNAIIPGLDITLQPHRIALSLLAKTHGAEHMPNMTLSSGEGRSRVEQQATIIAFGRGINAPSLVFKHHGTKSPVTVMEFKVPKVFTEDQRTKVVTFLRALNEEIKPKKLTKP